MVSDVNNQLCPENVRVVPLTHTIYQLVSIPLLVIQNNLLIASTQTTELYAHDTTGQFEPLVIPDEVSTTNDVVSLDGHITNLSIATCTMLPTKFAHLHSVAICVGVIDVITCGQASIVNVVPVTSYDAHTTSVPFSQTIANLSVSSFTAIWFHTSTLLATSVPKDILE